MKTMKKLFSMAALAMVGATFTGCSSSDDNIIDQPQQPETKNNVVTLTTTVGFDEAAGTTRALAADGVKTFAAGETMALVYKNTSGATVKVVSTALTDGNITNSGKTATFTFELTDPDKTKDVTYIYPAAMANADGTVNYSALNSQNGTLASLAANLDCCTKSGAWSGDNLPSLTLENQLAILAITLKNADGSSEITGSITRMTLSDGTYNYIVSRSAAAGPVYVAIRPTSSASIDITATDGSNPYTKSLTSKTYAANNGYSVSWRMSAEASKAVDLGLSVKWAKMNVLATSVGHYGQFFAWGETTGYGSNTADGHNFDWASYSLCGGSNTTLTKYNNNASFGTVDNKTTLEAADDAATANWGSKWRMPTYAELNELLATKSNANYTWTWTTVDGHNGYKITNKTTSAYIFLPASGYRSDDILYNQSTHGEYWSSSLYESNPRAGRRLYFISGNAYMDFGTRFYVRSVRAVQKN